MDEAELARRYGSMGLRLSRLAHGRDARTVKSSSKAKSISAETTFNHDKASAEELVPILHQLSEKVSASLKSKDVAGRTIVLKLKTADFKARTRNRAQADPTQLADRIFHVGEAMLRKELDGTKFRLIGIGVSDLCSAEDADPVDLVDHQGAKRAAAERAMDKVRHKFGTKSVGLGLSFKKEKTAAPQRDQNGDGKKDT
jgi:DNA polymerase-4